MGVCLPYFAMAASDCRLIQPDSEPVASQGCLHLLIFFVENQGSNKKTGNLNDWPVVNT